MGSVKNEWIEWEMEQPRRDWIMEEYGLGEEEEGTEAWQKASEDYDRQLESGALDFDEDWFTPDELTKQAHRKFTSTHDIFLLQITDIISLINKQDSPLFNKMSISYAVTLMETCLQDMLLSVAVASDDYRRNALKNLTGLKDEKIPISDLLDMDNIAWLDKKILEDISKRLFHKITNVVKIYEAVLNKTMAAEVRLTVPELNVIMELRHDIVHRNGKTQDGKSRDISAEDARLVVERIRGFVEKIYGWLIINVYLDDI
ncbi:hypothetical protein J2125_004969 [Erwinia toletana]|uniref:RiboL-PSP-HEPN domain-containing protein n=1 Tax=Winslowiella toletana TaxID=92490 RepID=A0ABS4PIG0_9GAMM|nr:HEPN domain-containing protein [Winslowiella toletana]MBP2171673.1 hypothetical protein [Winslowiella toletana]